MPREHHPDGYLKHKRRSIGKRDPKERAGDYAEIWAPDWDPEHLKDQGERCVDCGVPTCMSGCPIGNRIPEWNDLVHKEDWKEALEQLHATNNFPEFTGYTCPAPCEDACVLSYNDDPVTIKSIERAIVDKGWKEGWIQPEPPTSRTDHRVAIIGSGPAGLAAAQQLNRAGHHVTVYERDDAPGGLMTYGIPDFKFAKKRVDQRVDQLQQEGIEFVTGTAIGPDLAADRLHDEYDATCLAIGAQKHRELPVPGTDLAGVMPAMDFLPQENRRQHGTSVPNGVTAEGKNVVVLGGGDTGADCVATAHRQGAKQVVQIGINQKPPSERPADNPWPETAQVFKKTYAQEEGGTQEFAVNTTELADTDGDGHVNELRAERVEWTYENGSRVDKTVIDPDFRVAADLVLVAIGFTGPESNPFSSLGVQLNDHGTFATDDNLMTDVDGVFAAGDARMGASLVVWAIGEGRDAARQIDRYLMGTSKLPASLQTQNPPIPFR
ncbi:glutamate synthase [Salinibacter sp. 10B]|uniref:glutamate synthase subunit beta n=1 Tax=Salinibacter sp. 10B TaxID=1923971 RepID=UPI000CF47A75|nr:glutamate synthase subunit beta [Salinibacter sp. 10B]PQJ35251.1 glutamate synthase [Salinibacter sp. 10B]